MSWTFKKQVSILATFTLLTSVGKKAIIEFVLCIHHLIQFRKNKTSNVQALIDLGSEINARFSAYIKKLGL